MPDVVLGMFYVFIHLIPLMQELGTIAIILILNGFMEVCSRSHSELVAELEFKPRPSGSRS